MIRSSVSVPYQYLQQKMQYLSMRTLQRSLERHLPVMQNTHPQRSLGVRLCPMDMNKVQTVHRRPYSVARKP